MPFNRWKLSDGRQIDLLTPDQLDAVAEGTLLYNIQGQTRVKGADPLDRDTRQGLTAWGMMVRDPAPIMQRMSRDDTLMAVAGVMALRSTCQRANVGAVVAREGRILVTGYNGAPAGMPHCNHRPDNTATNGCRNAVHAETNAIAYAARYGISLENSAIYTTLSPCLACSQIIVNAGITRAVYSHEYRDTIGVDMLRDAGLVVDYLP